MTDLPAFLAERVPRITDDPRNGISRSYASGWNHCQEQILAALRAYAEQQGWQPITTLDADTEAILWTPRERIYTKEQLEAFPDLPAGEWRVSSPRHWTWATLWKPLPPAPSSSEEK